MVVRAVYLLPQWVFALNANQDTSLTKDAATFAHQATTALNTLTNAIALNVKTHTT